MPWDLGGETDPPVWHKHPIDRYKKPRFKKLVGTTQEYLVTRDQWGAAEPTSREKLNNRCPPFLKYPASEMANHVHFTHTAMSECGTEDECKDVMRSLQIKHMEAGETDIRHSFVVGGDGKVYEGRGWDTMANVPDEFTMFESASLDIAVAGDFSKKKPGKEMIKSLKNLFNWGIANRKIYCCFDKTYDFTLRNMYYGPSVDDSEEEQ